MSAEPEPPGIFDAVQHLADAIAATGLAPTRTAIIGCVDAWLATPRAHTYAVLSQSLDSISGQDNLQGQDNLKPSLFSDQQFLREQPDTQGTIDNPHTKVCGIENAKSPRQRPLRLVTKASLDANVAREQLRPLISAVLVNGQSFSDWWSRGNRADVIKMLSAEKPLTVAQIVQATADFIDERARLPRRMTWVTDFLELREAARWRVPKPTRERPYPMSDAEFEIGFTKEFGIAPSADPGKAAAMRRIWETTPDD